MQILNLMPARCSKKVGTGGRKDWESCEIRPGRNTWNIPHIDRLIGIG